jgi:hypothetical protein
MATAAVNFSLKSVTQQQNQSDSEIHLEDPAIRQRHAIAEKPAANDAAATCATQSSHDGRETE